MIKTAFRLLITISIVILSVYFYIQSKARYVKDSHLFITFNSESDMEQGIKYLKKSGLDKLLYLDIVTLPINNYFDSREMTLKQISSKIDVNDYRYDSFVKSLPQLFDDGSGGYNSVYVELGKGSTYRIIKFSYFARKNLLDFKFSTPGFIRQLLNYICVILILFIFGMGCKTRTIVSALSAVVMFFFIDISSYYNFISFTLGYFLITFIIESVSFSNRYVRRNNIGFIRTLICIALFSLPTFYPYLTGMTYNSKLISTTKNMDLDYTSLESLYSSESPAVSNFFAHYAYQKSYIYGEKYKFPKENSSVKMVEFQKKDYYLIERNETVMSFDQGFHESFIEYCESTDLGRFYLNIGQSFKLESDIMFTSYKKEKEYMQIGILAVTMLLSSAFFKKKRR